MVNFESLFGEVEIKETNTGGKYTPLVPDTILQEDGSYTIAGPIVGVELESLIFDEKNNAAVFKFAKNGATIPKFINDPETNQYIQNEPDEAKKIENTKKVYNEIKQNVQNFVWKSAVEKALFDSKFTSFKTFVEALSQLVASGESKTPNVVSLKVTFKDTQSDEMKFVIPSWGYLSNNEQYPVVWGKKDENKNPAIVGSNDSKNYGYQNWVKIESTPDFHSNGIDSNIDDIFSTGTLNPGTLL